MLTIKCAFESNRSKPTILAQFVISDDIRLFNKNKRIVYQSQKSFKDNMILAARVLVAEHGVQVQKWQCNILECQDIALFSTCDCLQSIEF
jgi:hypothetical protein